MTAFLNTWAGAFCLTQLVEIPVYLYAARRLRPLPRWIFAAGASTLTHPVIWFLFPWGLADRGSWMAGSFPWNLEDRQAWMAVFLAAESFAVLAETAWAVAFRVAHPFEWALAANAASVVAGFLLREL
jgi:hypothetical protein